MDADEDDASRNDLDQRQQEDVVKAVVVGDEFQCEGGGVGDVDGVTMGNEGRETVVVDVDDAIVEDEIDGDGVAGVVEAGESGGGFGQRISGIGDQDKGNVELVGSEDVTEADVADDEVAVKGEGDGAENVVGGDDEKGVERREDAVMVADGRESGGFGEQVSGFGDPLKAALMEGEGEGEVEVDDVVYAEEMDGIELGRGNESGIEMKEDGVVGEDVGECGGFDGKVSGIGDQAVEEAELMESEDAMEADAEGTVMIVEEEMDRIETVLGGDDERGSERKEELLAIPDGGEGMELIKHVVGIRDGELSGKVELMESEDVREMDAGVVDMPGDEEEDAVVGVNGDVIKEDEIDDGVTTGGRDDVVASGVDDGQAMKEEEVVAFVVEGDKTAMMEGEGVDVGSCDAMLDMEVVELKENEIGIVTVDGSSCNGESTVRAVSFEVKDNGIANVEGQILLAENEVVTDRGGLSKGVVLVVDEIARAEKDFCETFVASNAGATGAMVEDENETVDRIGVGDKELAKEVTGMSDKIGTEAVENAVLGDKDVDDVAEEQQVTEGMDRTEKKAATEDTDMAEKETEKVEQQERDALLKGGRTSKGGRGSTRKKLDEDVCFFCFDGGDLVLCDRRGCPKAYHPSCVNRDESFFQTKGQWNCGWHICSSCKKNAHYFCYTCTFSLCKGCIKDAAIYVVRGKKGFCDICIRTVKMIESMIKGDNQMGSADFDDKTSWEYLFKEYYMDLKEKLSLSAEEIQEAKNPWKGAEVNSRKEEFDDDTHDVNNGQVGSDDLAGQSTVSVPKKRKASKQIKPQAKERYMQKKSNGVSATEASIIDGAKWATRELLEFVMHTRKGDLSVLSQYDVQALLLEYIKTNKLRDPRKKSQIICDSRLQNLFGKSCLGHFEMLKLLESHFLVKDDTNDLQGNVADTGTNLADVDQEWNASLKSGKQKKSKTKKRGNGRELQPNIDDYAAIDMHNITLIYLRRSLVEYLLEDAATFDNKVIGSFVRIRIPGNNPKLEMYRLVPIIGTSKVPKPYKVGKKQTDYVLDIQNFGKTEKVQIDIISNQEFTQEECIRLKQSMKYGIINRLTVGDIQDKAISLQEVRVKDEIDAEIVRLSHLRDRASEKGLAKELRECVEKLQLLKTPQERQRRLKKVPEIHVDAKMDPNNESDDDEDILTRGRSTASGGRSQDHISPSKDVSALTETWRDGPRTPLFGNRDITRSMSGKGLEGWNEDGSRGGNYGNQISSWNKPSNLSSDIGAGTNTRLRMEPTTGFAPETPVASRSLSMQEVTPMVNELEKMWQYKDPSGKIHGPFSIVQLRKWNSTGYFPAALRIWRSSETQDDSILLADALKGKYQRDTPKTVFTNPATQFPYSLREPVRDHVMPSVTPSSMDIPKISGSQWSSTRNLPSPSSLRTATAELKWPHASSLQNGSAVAHSSSASLITNGGMSGADVLRNVSSVLAQDPNVLMNAASALLAQSQSALSGQQRLTVEAHVQTAQSPQMMNPGLTIQNLVQVVQSPNPTVNAWGWGSAPPTSSDLAKLPPVGGRWGEQNPASYGTGGSISAVSNAWRPNPGEELSKESASIPGVNWAASNHTTNLFASSVTDTGSSSLQNPNPNWVQGPGNTSWVASAPGNGNGNWSANPNVSRTQGPGMMPGWNPPNQGQQFGNTTNAGAMSSNQAPPHDQGLQGSLMEETSSIDGRYRERTDYGYGGGRTWSGQSSFGGGGGGTRDQGVCWYQDEYGNCRRGGFCKFRHAGAGYLQ